MLAIGFAGAALVGIGVWALQQRSNSAPLGQPALPSVAPLVESAVVQPSATVSSDNAIAKPTIEDVTIAFSDAPKETKIFRGNAEIGTVAEPLRLPRSNEKVTLRFVADSYAPTEVDVIPNVDQTVTVTLKAAKPTAAPPTKRKVPKELEPF